MTKTVTESTPKRQTSENSKTNSKGIKITWKHKHIHLDNPVNLGTWIPNLEKFLIEAAAMGLILPAKTTAAEAGQSNVDRNKVTGTKVQIKYIGSASRGGGYVSKVKDHTFVTWSCKSVIPSPSLSHQSYHTKHDLNDTVDKRNNNCKTTIGNTKVNDKTTGRHDTNISVTATPPQGTVGELINVSTSEKVTCYQRYNKTPNTELGHSSSQNVLTCVGKIPNIKHCITTTHAQRCYDKNSTADLLVNQKRPCGCICNKYNKIPDPTTTGNTHTVPSMPVSNNNNQLRGHTSSEAPVTSLSLETNIQIQQDAIIRRKGHAAPLPSTVCQVERKGHPTSLPSTVFQVQRKGHPAPLPSAVCQVKGKGHSPPLPSTDCQFQRKGHPAPLPSTACEPSTGLTVLPKPRLILSRVEKGILLSWNMPASVKMQDISMYILFAYRQSSAVPNTKLWKKASVMKAVQSPMLCLLTQLKTGNTYHFAVHAVDKSQRAGYFSDPCSIHITSY